MVTRIPAERRVLKWARETSGLTIEDAATHLGCRPDLLRGIEEGKKLPSASMFRDMASVYGFPEATLLAVDPPVLPAFPKDHRTFDGIHPTLTHNTILAIRNVQMRQESLKELAEFNDDIAAPTLRRYVVADNPETVANAERRRFAVTPKEQLEISADKLWMTYRLRIEAQGISVYVEDFPIDDTRGISLFVDDFPAIILSSREQRPQWKLFSLLHEYAHVLIRDPGISDQKRTTRSEAEAFCNKFAAAFLMPESAIAQVLVVSRDTPREFTLAALDEAASALSVSISALALRIEDLGFAPAGYFNRVRSMIQPPKKRKHGDGAPPRQYVVLNQVGHKFAGDVLRSVDSGVLTTLEASRMLRANPKLLPTINTTIESRRRDYLYAGAEN